jgi:hypothetical protein
MNELMRVLEQLLIEVEPLLYAKRQDIEKLVIEKLAWAEKYNRTCGNSNEMWFYSQEYRRALEKDIQPLVNIIAKANKVLDNHIEEIYIEDY